MRGVSFILAAIGFACASPVPAGYATQWRTDRGNLEVEFSPAPTEAVHQLVLDWVRSAERSVTVYYKRFPVEHLLIRVNLFEGRGVRSGQAFGGDGAFIAISVGRSSTAADFSNDWMMTHEMVHLAFPSVAERHHWIEEGSATYVEPVARARAGDLTPEKVWGDLVDGLPQGLPVGGDRGLDFTPTWGRTYWGGALFCLLADIEIRKRTANQKGLEHALRAILQEGGTIESEWDLARALQVGDRAVGASILTDLYYKMKSKAVPIDLDTLWKELGVIRLEHKIEFDDAAPLAPVRKAITQPN